MAITRCLGCGKAIDISKLKCNSCIELQLAEATGVAPSELYRRVRAYIMDTGIVTKRCVCEQFNLPLQLPNDWILEGKIQEIIETKRMCGCGAETINGRFCEKCAAKMHKVVFESSIAKNKVMSTLKFNNN